MFPAFFYHPTLGKRLFSSYLDLQEAQAKDPGWEDSPDKASLPPAAVTPAPHNPRAIPTESIQLVADGAGHATCPSCGQALVVPMPAPAADGKPGKPAKPVKPAPAPKKGKGAAAPPATPPAVVEPKPDGRSVRDSEKSERQRLADALAE